MVPASTSTAARTSRPPHCEWGLENGAVDSEAMRMRAAYYWSGVNLMGRLGVAM